MKQIIVLAVLSLFLLLGMTIYQRIVFFDGKLHVVFCNVGQGDGIFIRTPKGENVVLDGGPDDKILACIASHTPFWDKTIALMLLSHPHADHLNGLVNTLQGYTVATFATEKLTNTSAGYSTLVSELVKNNLSQNFLSAGTIFQLDDKVSFRVVGPTKAFLAETSPDGKIGDSKEFGSLETLLSFDSFNVLFTGDSQADELAQGVSQIASQVQILQVPHHGSKTGLSKEILTRLRPQFSVISVGVNPYGHPNQETLSLLSSMNIPFSRTDKQGDIEIISDGKNWWVK